MRNLFLALMLFASPVMAQDSVMVSVPRSALTAQQLAGVEAQGIKEKADAYGAWVGVGKEVGEAVNSSLSAISDNAAKFADTKVGKFSMFIVAWKVLGNDILGVFYALVITFIGLPILIWSYRRHLTHTVLDKEIVVDGKVTERKYRNLDYSEINSRDGILFFHAVGATILLAAVSIALFA
jgi:hypothetical protein